MQGSPGDQLSGLLCSRKSQRNQVQHNSSEFKAYISFNHLQERSSHQIYMKLKKENQDLLDLLQKFQRENDSLRERNQHLEKTLKLNKQIFEGTIQSLKSSIKKRDKSLQSLNKKLVAASKENRSDNLPNRISENESFILENTFRQLQQLQKQVQGIYQRVRFGITKRWKVSEFNRYRNSLRCSEDQVAERQLNLSVNMTVAKIKDKIGKLNHTITQIQGYSGQSCKTLQQRFSHLKKKREMLDQIPFIEANQPQQEIMKHGQILRRINDKIRCLSENAQLRTL